MNNPEPKSQEEQYIPYQYPIAEQLFLEKPQTNRTANIFEIVLRRKSIRQFSPLTLTQLSDLLWYTAHVKGIFCQDNGYMLSHRPSPSAGGRHPIDLILSSRVLGTDALYVYDPFEHSLNKLVVPKDKIQLLYAHGQSVMQAAEGTTIWFMAHPSRTSAKYDNAESLIWRDTGALIYCIQLVATALQINSTPLGTLGKPFLDNLFDTRTEVTGAGGIVLG
jgi:SagB-type dehydrogenase family enzyme